MSSPMIVTQQGNLERLEESYLGLEGSFLGNYGKDSHKKVLLWGGLNC